MLLPYASYLRVYEPAEHLPTLAGGWSVGDPLLDSSGTVTLAREQHTVLTRSIAQAVATGRSDDLVGGYLLRRDERLYVCPLDLALRSWLAVAEFGDETDAATQSLFLAREVRESVDGEYAAWRTLNPSAMPHIRQATWGVPRTWFLLVAQEERESYDLDGASSVRFRTLVVDARRRLLSAFSVLSSTIDDDDLIEDLSDLGAWLASFSDDSWLELDYAGVARLLGSQLDGDRSAHEITRALRAIARGDFGVAGETYRTFVERWRAVTALERAN